MAVLLITAAWLLQGCSATRTLGEGEYLLRKNTLKIRSDVPLTRRGEFSDNMEQLIVQKKNTYLLRMPYKVWLYNIRYKKYNEDTTNFQLQTRTVEKPVVYDSTLKKRSVFNMKSYLYNQGYFYAQITDTTVFRKRKAYVTYRVNTGTNYLINEVKPDVDDSDILAIINRSMENTILKKGAEYSSSLAEEERNRLTNEIRNNGYYKFSADNISFVLDTVNKQYFRDIENPFESAINFVALQRDKKKPTLDIAIVVRKGNDSSSYYKYVVNRVRIYPDFVDRSDIRDSTLIEKKIEDVTFRYHNYYIREGVIHKHLYIEKGRLYSQNSYDQTITKLNDLGVFQSIRIFISEDTSVKQEHLLNYTILMSPAKRRDFGVSYEVYRASNSLSQVSNYSLGTSLSLNFRERNLGRGANQLTTTLSGGIETAYFPERGNNFFEHFFILTRNYGISATLDLPKFLVPFRVDRASNRNLPRTIIGVGTSFIDRIDYFTLTNTAANFTYNWRETNTKTWEVTPAFVNLIRLPRIDDSFQVRLAENDFLRNTYRETFIEGESIIFTYNNRGYNNRLSYSYLRFGIEEAGGIFTLLTKLGGSLNTPTVGYSQYYKLDADVQRHILWRHSEVALRFLGGVGIPYDKSVTLPYIKQYFVGGAYSIRGWRIRSLGPGSFFDTTGSATNTINYIDRTGDIRLETNAEYRFDIVQLFSGSLKLKGAAFVDGGNIWLTRKSASFPGGEFAFNKLWQDFAISTGTGARLDIGGFFIFRLDVAFPIKKPYVMNDSGWVIDEIDFLYNKWRQQNLVLSFAIGYPF